MYNVRAPELYGDECYGSVQKNAYEVIRLWCEQDNILIVDTETTGLEPSDEILEFAACDLTGNAMFESLIRPTKKKSWKTAQSIHGISASDVETAPTWVQVASAIEDLLRDRMVLIYNAQYDVRLIRQSAQAAAVMPPVLSAECVMLQFARWRGIRSWRHQSWKWHKLDVAAKDVGVKRVGRAHRAMSDAQLTAAIVRAIGMKADPRQAGTSPFKTNKHSRPITDNPGDAEGMPIPLQSHAGTRRLI